MKKQNEGLAYTENTYLNKSGNAPDPSGKGRHKRYSIWLKILALILLVAMVIGVIWVYYAIKNFNSNYSRTVICCKRCGKVCRWGDFNYSHVRKYGTCSKCSDWIKP